MGKLGEADGVLLTAAAAGDRRAFDVLFERHARAVTRYAWALVSDRMDVQEIVQDTFVTAWTKAGAVKIVDTSALPWLLVTCRNHALNSRRRKMSSRTEAFPSELADVARHEDVAVSRQRLKWVLAEIAALDPIDRRICELCLIEGRSYREAAVMVGKSVGAVSKRLERARTRIRTAVTNLDS